MRNNISKKERMNARKGKTKTYVSKAEQKIINDEILAIAHESKILRSLHRGLNHGSKRQCPICHTHKYHEEFPGKSKSCWGCINASEKKRHNIRQSIIDMR